MAFLPTTSGKGGDVVIPDGVTAIGNDAFADSINLDYPLTSVTIPDSVTSIGTELFRDASAFPPLPLGAGSSASVSMLSRTARNLAVLHCRIA